VTDDLTFELLHVLRIKGLVGIEPLEEALGVPVEALDGALAQLQAEALVAELTGAVAGWVLTPSGIEWHAAELVARRTPELEHGVAAAYETFLDENAPVKQILSGWQEGSGDTGSVLAELFDRHENAIEALEYAGRFAVRFRRYGHCLERALERVGDGDARYLTEPLIDSYHTVWFECHEDFLLTLGRSREAEPA
jgi:hypothetical protein